MTVEWHEDALEELADIWVAATLPDQGEIEQGVLRINARLAAGGYGLGESREDDNHRVWFAPPLVVAFWMVQGEPLILVTHVARLRPGFPDD